MVFYSKYLPVVSFVVGISALAFQTIVLYPWHNELDAELKRLKQQKEMQDHKLENYNSQKMDMIHSLEDRLNHLIEIEY